MNMSITAEESLLSQMVSMATLILALQSNQFLRSEFYKEMNFPFGCGNKGIENEDEQNAEKFMHYILERSGVFNPATAQMLLYGLIVVPREMLKGSDDEECISRCKEKVNTILQNNSGRLHTTQTTYKGETVSSMNYYKHIRNALAHARCIYTPEEDADHCVTFSDVDMRDENQHCEIKISTFVLGMIILAIRDEITIYLNQKWEKRKGSH